MLGESASAERFEGQLREAYKLRTYPKHSPMKRNWKEFKKLQSFEIQKSQSIESDWLDNRERSVLYGFGLAN